MNSEFIYSCVTLTLIELVLGIDNIIFVSILSDKLDESKRDKARNLGIMLSVILRVLLLFLVNFILSLQKPFLNIAPIQLSIKDLMLLIGGLFLIYKTVKELLYKLKVIKPETQNLKQVAVTFSNVLLQIMIINVVFSVDTILTAIGLVDSILVMGIAIVASSLLMLVFVKPIVNIINKYPGIKLLAFVFLILIGFYLVAEAFHIELSKAYLYCSMVVALVCEWLNILYRKANPTKF